MRPHIILQQSMSADTIVSKPHYRILDGLRGVAALMVVAMHIFETHASTYHEMIINHGYLAVDFFFVLSGFVIGYAYDDRWNKLTTKEFFIRRLARLQPMVIMGMVIGAIFFYTQDGSFWPKISEVPVWSMLLIMLLGFFMIPVPPSMDIRGWAEMYPLNGPGWTLFFEYIGNILYATILRRISNTILAILVFLAACFLTHMAVTGKGDVIGGWAIDMVNIHIGFARLLYPFLAGLLLSRMAKLIYIKNAFLWCSLLIITALSIPRIGGQDNLWMNGIYESLIIIFLFPAIVYMGASGDVKGKFSSKLCNFLGHISYPIYITHYPLIYTYTAWVKNNKLTLQEAFPGALLVFFSAILLAWACLKLYDEPVRKWLTAKFITRK